VLVFLILICIAAITILILPYLLIPQNTLPQPSGKWQVGASEIVWESPDYPQVGIIAKVWYPTDEKSGIKSAYLSKISGDFSEKISVNLVYKLIFALLRRVAAIPAFINATPIQIPNGLPVILFSPGFGGINSLGTFYALEFASHGFIVIGVNHPNSNFGTICTDGSQIKFEDFDLSVFDRPDKLEQYIGNVTRTQSINLSIIVDEIIRLNSISESLLYQRIDASNIFAAGHSAGGSASFVACGRDRRIAKAIDLDGTYVDLEIEDTDYTGKKLLLFYSDREKYKPKNEKSIRQWDAMRSIDKKWMDKLAKKSSLQKKWFESTTHNGFTDLSILINPIIGKKIGLSGEADGLTVLRASATVMIDFLDE
jgi:hypothetical protein